MIITRTIINNDTMIGLLLEWQAQRMNNNYMKYQMTMTPLQQPAYEGKQSKPQYYEL